MVGVAGNSVKCSQREKSAFLDWNGQPCERAAEVVMQFFFSLCLRDTVNSSGYAVLRFSDSPSTGTGLKGQGIGLGFL